MGEVIVVLSGWGLELELIGGMIEKKWLCWRGNLGWVV